LTADNGIGRCIAINTGFKRIDICEIKACVTSLLCGGCSTGKAEIRHKIIVLAFASLIYEAGGAIAAKLCSSLEVKIGTV